MKTKFLAVAAPLALVATLGHFYGKPLVAQVRAALVRDVDNPARNALQFYLYVGGTVTTYHVPVGKILVIEDVSILTEYNITGTFGISTTVKGVAVTHWFSPGGYVSTGVATGGSFFGGRPTRIYADPGTDVFIQSAGAVLNGECAFSGYLLDASN